MAYDAEQFPDRANNFLYPKLTGKTRSQWLIDATMYAHVHAQPAAKTCRKAYHSDRCKCTRCASVTAYRAKYLHEQAGWNYSAIGRALDRDHSTIMWAIERVRG